MQDNELLNTVAQNEWDAIIGSILKKFKGFCRSDALMSYEDLVQEAWIALLDSTKTYDPAKSKFTTYAYRSIYYHLCRYVSGKIRNKPTQVATDPFSILSNKSYQDDSAERNDMLETLFALVDGEKHSELLYEYFVKERSLRDIARDQDVSRTTIQNRVGKLIDNLNYRLNHENA